MALTISSPRVFNGNVGKQAYTSGSSNSTGSKCHCCPYGYHIDLDFVEYCEAVAAGNSDKNSIERRKKRERRRQCQSMEILLGLVNPSGISGIENELSELSQPAADTNGVTTSLRLGQSVKTPDNLQVPTALDLSDVVGDFEATLKRLSKPKKPRNKNQNEIDGIQTSPIHIIQTDPSADFDAASTGSGTSILSTNALQNVREQMALSLERMKELEEQVKLIPMLQVQVSVLKEEKRCLQKQIDESRPRRNYFEDLNDRSRNNSSTRDMGVMCGVMTRDVGVSHQQIRTRDVGMITSTPIQPLRNDVALNFSYSPTLKRKKNDNSTIDTDDINSFLDTCSLSRLSQTSINLSPKMNRLNNNSREYKDFSTNTENIKPIKLVKSSLIYEEILPEANFKKSELKTQSCLTELNMKNILTTDDIKKIRDDAVKLYKDSIKNSIPLKLNKSTQSNSQLPKVIVKKNQEIQVSEPFKMKCNVGVTAKPRTTEVGTEIGRNPCTRTIATGPDPVSIQPISLNAMNSRSHSFNYGDTKIKRKTTKSVGSTVDGLIKTTIKSTDTSGLGPKTRDFGTSPIKKKFVDVSVGDSLKPHISISCAANYCDNCKETIKSLAKQISNNNENIYRSHSDNQNGISRIPRPSHISLTPDFRKQFKRQDTYSKLPTGVIKYDADNKETYETNKLEQLDSEVTKDEKKESKEILSPEKDINNDEKTILPESALFEPIRDKSRVKKEPSKEMRAAMKVLNDNLKKSPSKNISHQIKNATNVIQQEWFKISSVASANPLDVEDYLDCFEEYSSFLLEYIVNMTDSSGNTAMHYAVSHGNFDVVSILLDSKVCDINKSNVAGYTAVMLAALADLKNSTHASVANRLFQLADVNIRAKLHGQTALMLAVSHGRKDMTRLLLDAGAAVNIQDEDGSTALMCAAEHGHTDIVRLLLAHPDCDSSIADIDGSSALKIALEAGHRDLGVLLYAHEHVRRGSSPFSLIRKPSKRGSKPTTPTGPSPSAPASPAPSRRFHSNTSITSSKYSAK